MYFHFLSAPLAKPKNSANIVTVQASSKSVVVAQCEAADGKPAANIKWLASVGGNHSTTTVNGPYGMVTVRSEYRLVPTPADNGREVTCLVDQRTQERPWVFPVKLSVECKNIVVSLLIRRSDPQHSQHVTKAIIIILKFHFCHLFFSTNVFSLH